MLFITVVWRPFKCNKWSFNVERHLALSCNQSRIISLVTLRLPTWTVIVLAVNLNLLLLLSISKKVLFFSVQNV